MKIKFILILFLLISAKLSFTQVDSLIKIIESTNDVNLKFVSINKLVAAQLNTAPEIAQKYALLQLGIVKVDTQVARAYCNIGLSLDYHKKSLEIDVLLHDPN